MRYVKKILKRSLWPLAAFRQLILRKESYLYSTGWLESLKRDYPCRSNGSEIPWMNYSIIKFLEDRLKNYFDLFEFGSGYSTCFYAKLVRSVASVEYDESWFQNVKKNIPKNVELIYKEKDTDGEYCRTIGSTDKKYDIVIVDGRDRVNCVKQSIEVLSAKGVILLDDSHREKYVEGINYAKKRGFRTLDFEGLKPTGSGIDRTTIIYRDSNCLDI
jgi:hypothetical protein